MGHDWGEDTEGKSNLVLRPLSRGDETPVRRSYGLGLRHHPTQVSDVEIAVRLLTAEAPLRRPVGSVLLDGRNIHPVVPEDVTKQGPDPSGTGPRVDGVEVVRRLGTVPGVSVVHTGPGRGHVDAPATHDTLG